MWLVVEAQELETEKGAEYCRVEDVGVKLRTWDPKRAATERKRDLLHCVR